MQEEEGDDDESEEQRPGDLQNEPKKTAVAESSAFIARFEQGLPGKAVPEMAPLSAVPQASAASEEVPRARWVRLPGRTQRRTAESKGISDDIMTG